MKLPIVCRRPDAPAPQGGNSSADKMMEQNVELSESQMALPDQKLTLIDDATQDGYHPLHRWLISYRIYIFHDGIEYFLLIQH